MKRIAILLLLTACAATGPGAPTQSAADNKAWLQQLVGEWTVSCRAIMEPGGEPMLMESTESCRSIGQWTVGEGKATFGGQPFTSLMTLGYDAAKRRFVGTWIDSMQSHLWIYDGSLDPSGKLLTLNTEGPAFGDESRTALYRDAIEIRSPDHRVLTSSVRGADGTWTTFLTADYRRRN